MRAKLTPSEFSLRFLVLTVLERSPNHKREIRQIIDLLERSEWISPSERPSVESRDDSRIANRINNIFCHRDSSTSMIRRGLINRVEMAGRAKGYALTENGRKWLATWREKFGIDDSTDHAAVNGLLRRLSGMRK